MAALKQSVWTGSWHGLKNIILIKRKNEKKNPSLWHNPSYSLDPATGKLVEHLLVQRFVLVLGPRGQKNIASNELVHHLTVHLGTDEGQAGLICKLYCYLEKKRKGFTEKMTKEQKHRKQKMQNTSAPSWSPSWHSIASCYWSARS